MNYEFITLKSTLQTNAKDERLFIFNLSQWLCKCFHIPDSPVEESMRFDLENRSTLHTLMIYVLSAKEYLEHDVEKVQTTDSMQFIGNAAD